MPSQFQVDLAIAEQSQDFICWHIRKARPGAVVVTGFFPGYDILAPPKKKTKDSRDVQVEVKYDRMSRKTGNIVIEYKDRGHLSGISTSTATHWVIIYWDGGKWMFMYVPVDILKSACSGAWPVSGGDDGTTLMYLINPNSVAKTPRVKTYELEPLLEEYKEWREKGNIV